MLYRPFFALLGCLALTRAVPFPHGEVPPSATNVTSLFPRASNADSCPGYAASNVVTTDSTLTADLTLAGEACNVFSDDIKDLKLLVEYQTSKCLHLPSYTPWNIL